MNIVVLLLKISTKQAAASDGFAKSEAVAALGIPEELESSQV